MDLLYRTENHIRHLVITYNGKESERRIHTTESLCYIPETNTAFIVSQIYFNGVGVGGDTKTSAGFPGGSVVKDPPANAGDTGSSPVPGRSHMLQDN